MKEKGI